MFNYHSNPSPKALPAKSQTVLDFSVRPIEVCLSPTPLYMACYYGHKDVVGLLLESGAADNLPSSTHCFHQNFPDIEATIHFTPCASHAYVLEQDGTCSEAESASRFPNRIMSRWKYPLAVAIERGHKDIEPLLSALPREWTSDPKLFSARSLEIYSTQERATQQTIFDHIARGIRLADSAGRFSQ